MAYFSFASLILKYLQTPKATEMSCQDWRQSFLSQTVWTGFFARSVMEHVDSAAIRHMIEIYWAYWLMVKIPILSWYKLYMHKTQGFERLMMPIDFFQNVPQHGECLFQKMWPTYQDYFLKCMFDAASSSTVLSQYLFEKTSESSSLLHLICDSYFSTTIWVALLSSFWEKNCEHLLWQLVKKDKGNGEKSVLEQLCHFGRKDIVDLLLDRFPTILEGQQKAVLYSCRQTAQPKLPVLFHSILGAEFIMSDPYILHSCVMFRHYETLISMITHTTCTWAHWNTVGEKGLTAYQLLFLFPALTEKESEQVAFLMSLLFVIYPKETEQLIWRVAKNQLRGWDFSISNEDYVTLIGQWSVSEMSAIPNSLWAQNCFRL